MGTARNGKQLLVSEWARHGIKRTRTQYYGHFLADTLALVGCGFWVSLYVCDRVDSTISRRPLSERCRGRLDGQCGVGRDDDICADIPHDASEVVYEKAALALRPLSANSIMQGMTSEQETLIVAVSGGVDSVVMLDRLVASDSRRLVVAHVDHGIREESRDDEAFVRTLAGTYGCEFVSTQLHLGPDASEDVARQARFAWLENIRETYGAEAIATAHHQDDVLETIIINLTRGTGWRGLCSLRETSHRHRPLLGLSKADIVDYALSHDLKWNEDSTNDTLLYLRNRIRSLVIPQLDAGARRRLLGLYDSQVRVRQEVDAELDVLTEQTMRDEQIDRYSLIMVGESVAIELLRAWLGEPLEQSRFRDLLLFAKTARAGSRWSFDSERFIVAKQRTLIVSPSRD